MLLDIENKFHNTFPFIWICEEIKSSGAVLEKIIDDQDEFIIRMKNELLEALNKSNHLDDENHIYLYEKNKWLTELFESNILNSSFVLIIINVENFLNLIFNQLKLLKSENLLPQSFKKCNSFGTKWKIRYQDYLLDDLSFKIDEGWELIDYLYKLRNKISHSGCYVDNTLKLKLESFNFNGIAFYEDANLKLHFVKINSEFLKEALSRLIEILFELMDNTYKKHCLHPKN